MKIHWIDGTYTLVLETSLGDCAQYSQTFFHATRKDGTKILGRYESVKFIEFID